MLEASAGTGKTFTIANLVARYVADGVAMEELLVVSFSRESTRELRERVRERLVSARDGLAAPASIPDDDRVLRLLADADAPTVAVTAAPARGSAHRLRRGHRHDHSRLRPAGAARAGHRGRPRHRRRCSSRTSVTWSPRWPTTSTCASGVRGRRAAGHEARRLPRARDGGRDRPGHRPAAAPRHRRLPGQRARIAAAVRAEVDRRKRRQQLIDYDDMLTRLADTLTDPGTGAGRVRPAAVALPGGAGRRVPGHRPGAVDDPARGVPRAPHPRADR